MSEHSNQCCGKTLFQKAEGKNIVQYACNVERTVVAERSLLPVTILMLYQTSSAPCSSRYVQSTSAAQWSARTVITNHLHSKNSCEALSCPTTGLVLDYLGRHCSRPRWSWQTYNFETKTNKQKELWGALTGLVLDNLGRHCSRPRRSSYLKFLCCISYWSNFS